MSSAVRTTARDPPARRRGVRRDGAARRLEDARRARGGGVSPSTVRAELAELERLGLLTHPHTSAGRVPTEAGYRLYADVLLARKRAAAAAVPARAGLGAGRGRGRAAGDDGDARAGDAAARARVGPAARGSDRAPRRRAPAAVERRDGGRDHVGRRGDEAELRVPGRGRPRPRDLGGRLPARAARRAAPTLAAARARIRRAEPVARGNGRSWRCSGARSMRSRRDVGCSSAAPRASSTISALEEIGAYRSLIDALEKRAALLDVLAQSLGRAARSSASATSSSRPGCTTSRSSGRPTATRTRRSAPSACSARCAWTTRRRSRVGPGSGPRAVSLRRGGLRRRLAAPPGADGTIAVSMATAEHDYYELLGVRRDADDADDQEGVPQARARAAP